MTSTKEIIPEKGKLKVGDYFTNSVGSRVVICHVFQTTGNVKVKSPNWGKDERYKMTYDEIHKRFEKGKYKCYVQAAQAECMYAIY